jgi:threonylcarbamoyladenosine tRNA methylthiotransferase MtaB
VGGSSEGDARRARVKLVALGCRVSRADVDALAAALGPGLELARDGERAELVVVNGCAITGDAEAAARQAIRRAAREHPGAAVIATGCYAELRPAALAALPGVAAVVGARRQGAVAAVLERLRAGEPVGGDGGDGEDGGDPVGPWGAAPAAPARHTRPFLKVQDGCDQRCAFCVVPDARGPSRSLPLDEALRRAALLGARHPEVVLTGVHLGAWGRDLAPRRSLAELVRAVIRGGAVRRLRLSSVEPNELPVELLREPAVAAALCPHLHLPLQSGAPRVLAAMGRPYRPEVFRAVIEEAAAALPGACLGTDVLVGFPGERDEDHAATVALVEALPLAYLHVFPFSARPGTRAATLPEQVPAAVVRDRARALRVLSERRWRAYLAAQVGRELEVVVERVAGGVARGTAREWVTVRWPAPAETRGTVVRVRVHGSDGTACLAARA